MKQERQRGGEGLGSLVFVSATPVVLITFLLVSLGSVCASEVRAPATILRIIDGDTVIAELNGITNRLRLANIDAPELTQPGGLASRDYLVALTTNRIITVHAHGRDRYNRTLATLFAGDTNINRAMVRAGYAWRYRYARKTGAIAEAEAEARAEGRGLSRIFHTFPAATLYSTARISRIDETPVCSVFTRLHRRSADSPTPDSTLQCFATKKCEICGLWATDGAIAPWEFRKGEDQRVEVCVRVRPNTPVPRTRTHLSRRSVAACPSSGGKTDTPTHKSSHLPASISSYPSNPPTEPKS